MNGIVKSSIQPVIKFRFKGSMVTIESEQKTFNRESYHKYTELLADNLLVNSTYKRWNLGFGSLVRSVKNVREQTRSVVYNVTIKMKDRERSFITTNPFDRESRLRISGYRNDIICYLRNRGKKYRPVMAESLYPFQILSSNTNLDRVASFNRVTSNNKFFINVFGSREVGFVHAEAGQILKIANRKKYQRLFESVSPKTSERHVGIEIECGIKGSKEKLAEKLCDLAGYVQIKGDGSVSVENREAVEIVLCAPLSSYKSILKKLTNVLNSEEVGAKVNKTCGLHVHLDVRESYGNGFNVNWSDLNNKFDKLVSIQSILYSMQPKSRQSNRYCMRTRKRGVTRSGSRYVGINAQAIWKYKTIETRLHAGTTDFIKIANWVDLLSAVMYSDVLPPKRAMSSVRSFFRTFTSVPTSLMEYVVERINKFQDVNAEEAEMSQAV